MSEDGLGTLAVLPREVRDMISSYVVATLKSSALYKTSPWFLSDILCHSPIQVNSQLRREFLESYLRDNDFLADSSIAEMDIFLRRLSPMADIPSHIRALGFEIRSWLFEGCTAADSPTLQDGHPDKNHEIRTVFRRIRKLRNCRDVHGISVHRLRIEMQYGLPLAPTSTRRSPLFRKIILLNRGLLSRVRIDVSSKSRSIAALDHEYNRLLLDIHSRLEEHLDAIRAVERDGSNDASWIAIQAHLNNSLRRSFSTFTSVMFDYHRTIIDQVIHFWEDEDEFEKFCLGDFFALAEAW